MFSTKTVLKIFLNSLLGLVLIVIWLHFVDLTQIWQRVGGANLILLFPVILLTFLSLAFRAMRLKLLLSPIKEVPLKELILLGGVAFFFNILIPIRAGELAKAIYLNKFFNLPIAKVITWIFLDRFLDFLFVLVFGGILILFIPTSINLTAIILLCLIGLILLLVSLLLINRVKLIKKLYKFAIETLLILKRPPADLAKLAALTLLAYIVDAGVWCFVFWSLGAPQDFLKMFLAQLLSALTYIVPAAPGYVGSAEASGALVLSGVLGIETNLASAATVILHLMNIVMAILAGVFCLSFLKIDPRNILNKAFKRS